ncbi:MAG: hypothetical protein SH817_07155 [Leptospira sp.]|nr:hypothetical protein [Leptospira sp.]
MVDLKKINIPKVNVDPKKMLGAADGLVDKIPPQVASLLKKIAVSLLVFFLLMAIYSGWSKGWENATPEGLQLASDTRSLFVTEIEKEYNRSRKDVHMSDPEDFKYESNHRMQFEFVSERESINPNQMPAPEEADFLGKERDFRNRKNESTTPPLATPSGEGLISSPIDIEEIGSWQNSNTLQELNEPKELERKDINLKPKEKNVSPSRMTEIEEKNNADDDRFNKIISKLSKLEKLAEQKKQKENKLPSQEPDTFTSPQKKVRELERIPR